MAEKKWEWKKGHIAVVLLMFYITCLVILSFVHYSDGDDAFFLEYCGNMGFLEYLKWRYETWTGRMISEAIMHIFFNLDIWAWRIVNAGMLTALPVVLAVLKKRVLADAKVQTDNVNRRLLVNVLLAVLVYLLLDINAFGYSAIWITGSMNYLWPMVFGIAALCVVARAAFSEECVPVWEYVAACVCAVIAAMSAEQMGAVLLAYVVVCIGEKVIRKKPVQTGLVLLAAVTVAAFLCSSLSPGNDLRIAGNIQYNMPQFEALNLGERGFILVQWLLSSVANESAVFFMAIWLGGILILFTKLKNNTITGKETIQAKVWMAVSGIFLVAGIAGKCGVGAITEMGINLAELTGLVEQVPRASDVTGIQWMAMIWWGLALVFTFFFLWKVSNKKFLVLLTYLGAVACEVIMILSPSIYSSGERVFFLTGLMLMFIVMLLYEALPMGKWRRGYLGALCFFGISNLILQVGELVEKILA